MVSEPLSLCASCIRGDFEKVKGRIEQVHWEAREPCGLPGSIPRGGAVACGSCVNACELDEGGTGYCGTRRVSGGKLEFRSGGPEFAFLEYYYDPLPTNCVADWVCPGSRMRGMQNLAVFYRACSFDCLFCQNRAFRSTDFSKTSPVSCVELAECVNASTACVCYFGGDPAPQVAHSIGAARKALESRPLRICWETNGSMNASSLDLMLDLALASGGIIKFDIKSYSDEMNMALCGTTNKRTLENLRRAARRFREGRDVPPIVASTLLVPGYLDSSEIRMISRFIASLDREIPYALLGFHPQCSMADLPATSLRHAAAAREIAVEEGLVNVHLGNARLLGHSVYPV